MKITADTNLLVRAAVKDDTEQARRVFELVTSAELVFIPTPCVLEFVWVLRSVYKLPRDTIAASVRALIDTENFVTDEHALEVGLQVYNAGGDFEDGIIASAGFAMGSEVFVSFDRQAVKHVRALGLPVRDASEIA